ncbi:MAG: fluoride efflux transporter CrcB [Actinobacteria bacterium]|nr:fluoride efflux transporter CrcB [Actinomycetota bacterium]
MRGQRNRPPRPDVRELAAIFAGGMLGALARVGLAQGFPHATGAWPWPTFSVNVAGALLLGWAVTRLPPGSYRRPFVGIGVCGALTTFSTLQLELLHMLDDGRWALALAYAAASLAGGLTAVRAGIALAREERRAP